MYINKWVQFNSYFVLTMHNVCSVIGQKRIAFLIFHRNLGLYLMSSWAVLTKNVIDAVAWDQSHMHSKLITWSNCCDVVFHLKEDYFHIVDLCCRAKIYSRYSLSIDVLIIKMLLYFIFFSESNTLFCISGYIFNQYLHAKPYKGIYILQCNMLRSLKVIVTTLINFYFLRWHELGAWETFAD